MARRLDRILVRHSKEGTRRLAFGVVLYGGRPPSGPCSTGSSRVQQCSSEEAPKLAPTKPPGGRQRISPLSNEPDQSTSSIRIDNNRSYVDFHNAGSAATPISWAPLWCYNGADDATRCGRKGPDNAAALVKILSELFKGEEEEFTRIKPRDGFSMYNPPS